MPILLTIFNDLWQWTIELAGWIWMHPSVLVLIGSGALIPACFWFWLYYRQVYMDKDDTKFMVITFLWGTSSVLIVLVVNYFSKILLGIDLADIVQDASRNGQVWLVIVGYMILGGLEEYAKFLIISRINNKQVSFNRIVDGIEYAIAGALGFAFLENIAYFAVAANEYAPGGLSNILALITNVNFIQVVIARNSGTMLMHTIFSGFIGYYYGKARVLELEAEISEKKKLHNYLLVKGVQSRVQRLKALWQNHHFPIPHSIRIRKDELIAEGLIVAMILHALYNSLLHFDLAWIIAPLVMLEFGLIMYELHLEKNLYVYDLEKAERNEIRLELRQGALQKALKTTPDKVTKKSQKNQLSN